MVRLLKVDFETESIISGNCYNLLSSTLSIDDFVLPQHTSYLRGKKFWRTDRNYKSKLQEYRCVHTTGDTTYNIHEIKLHRNESKHSEMGPVKQNPIQRHVKLFKKLCNYIMLHNTTYLNSSVNLPCTRLKACQINNYNNYSAPLYIFFKHFPCTHTCKTTPQISSKQTSQQIGF